MTTIQSFPVSSHRQKPKPSTLKNKIFNSYHHFG
ncbi:unnamed protein product, partial [Adineta steineri]